MPRKPEELNRPRIPEAFPVPPRHPVRLPCPPSPRPHSSPDPGGRLPSPSAASADTVFGLGCTVQPHLTAAGRGSPASPGSPRARSQEPLGKLSAGKVPAFEGGLPISKTPIKKTKTPGDGWWPTAVKQPGKNNRSKTAAVKQPGGRSLASRGEDRDRPPGVVSDRVGRLGRGARPTPVILPRPLRVRGRREPPRLRSIDSRGSPSGESSGCGAAVSAAPSTRSAEFVRGSP